MSYSTSLRRAIRRDQPKSIRLRQIARRWDRVTAAPDDYASYPPVLANGVTGDCVATLGSLLERLPGARDYGTAISSCLHTSPRLLNDDEHIEILDLLAPGELIRAHIQYTKIRHEVITGRGACHYFIYTDLRDVVVSEALSLANSTPQHHRYKFFNEILNSNEDRFRACIEGAEDRSLKVPFHSIDKRFEAFSGWLSKPDVCAVKFEDLMGPKRDTTIRRMADYFCARTDLAFAPSNIVSALERASQLPRSHASRRAPLWKQAFTPHLENLFDEYAGKLNRQLGYR